MRSASAEFAEGWGVLLASAAGFGLGLSGLPFYTMGVFVELLSATFHWSLAEIQGGLTVMLLANVVTLPAAGMAGDAVRGSAGRAGFRGPYSRSASWTWLLAQTRFCCWSAILPKSV